jgi:hypothetical protein
MSYRSGTRKKPEHFEKMSDAEAIRDLLKHLRRRQSSMGVEHTRMRRYEDAVLSLIKLAYRKGRVLDRKSAAEDEVQLELLFDIVEERFVD